MPRAAGNDKFYDFRLRDSNKGGFHRSELQIKVPSVTSVIGGVLAKHGLDRWAYWRTIDAVAGITSQAVSQDVPAEDILDVLTDADWLNEYMRDNRVRPEDQTRDAQTQGTKHHEFLERLAEAQLAATDLDVKVAEQAIKQRPSVQTAIADWWLSQNPHVIASEEVLVTTSPLVAGTVDLVWSKGGTIWVTDLKTREAGKEAYDSDKIQVRQYQTMWNQVATPLADRSTVLVCRTDGTWTEYPADVDPSIFGHLYEVFMALKGV